MPILIDGYNLLFARLGKVKLNSAEELERARTALLTMLSSYALTTREKITVFFDARNTPSMLSHREKCGTVDVVYVKSSSDADTEIKQVITKSRNPRVLLVVSSDRRLRDFTKAYGAKIVTSAAFLEDAVAAIETKPRREREPKVKFTGPTRGEVDYWMKIFGGEDQEK